MSSQKRHFGSSIPIERGISTLRIVASQTQREVKLGTINLFVIRFLKHSLRIKEQLSYLL